MAVPQNPTLKFKGKCPYKGGELVAAGTTDYLGNTVPKTKGEWIVETIFEEGGDSAVKLIPVPKGFAEKLAATKKGVKK